MTSGTQLIGSAFGATPGFQAFGRFPSRDDQQDAEPTVGGTSGTDGASTGTAGADNKDSNEIALPGRHRAADDVPRLPGQEGVERSGLRHRLFNGGAFVLAVALGLAADEQTQPQGPEPATPATIGGQGATETEGGKDAEGADGLTDDQRKQVDDLKDRDAEVRRHEAAHAAAGGQYAGAPTFTYQQGPDGHRYAVGGEVSIDISPVKGDPEATVRKAQQVKAAATAPAEPSPQDQRVAAAADALRQQAQAELLAQGTGGEPTDGAATPTGGKEGATDQSGTGQSGSGQGGGEQAAAEPTVPGLVVPGQAAAIGQAAAAGQAAVALVGTGQSTPEPAAETRQLLGRSDASGGPEPATVTQAPVGRAASDRAAGPDTSVPPAIGFGPAQSSGNGDDETAESAAGAASDRKSEETTEQTGGIVGATGQFAPGAFQAAAASYRGPVRSSSLVSIAV